MKQPINAPWRTTEGSYGNYIGVVDCNGKTVARVPWGDNDNAMANLIAAAPELLAAIKLFSQSDTWEFMQAAGKAVAKAEGRTL